MAHFEITIGTAQAKAALLEMQMANQRAAMAMKVQWTTLNIVIKTAIAGFLGLAAATAASVMAMNEFNKNLVHTAALGNLSTDEMAALSRQVMELGKHYGLSSTVMAEGTVVLAKAGLTMEQLGKAMEPVSQLMMANAVTFEQAAEIGVMAVNAFGKEYDDLTYLFDVSQHVSQQTLMNIEDLQQGLQYAGSTAQLAGVEFEELVSMMGVLSQNAMVAGVASRSMNRMLLSIVEKAPEVQRWADSMGLGIEVIKDGKVNITEILPAFAKLDTSIETLQDSMDIFSVRGMRAWGILIQNADDYLRLLDESSNAAGVLAATAGKQAESLTYIWGRIRESLLAPFRTEEVRKQITKTMQMFETSMGSVGTDLQSVVKDLVTEFGEWMGYFAPLLQSLISTLTTLMGIAKKFVGVIAGFNSKILLTYIVVKLIQRLNIISWLQKMMYATQILTIQKEIAEKQRSIEIVQYGQLQGRQAIYIADTQKEIAAGEASIVTLQARAQAYANIGKAGMGMALGMMMLITGMTKEMRLMGALVVTLNAVAVAYSVATLFRESFTKGTWAAIAGVGALVATASLLYTALAPIKTPSVPNISTGTTTSGMGLSGGGNYEGLQRGATVITKPTMALLHRGETVSSANKPTDVGGINIVVQGDLIDHETFFDRLEQELGKRISRERRQYI